MNQKIEEYQIHYHIRIYFATTSTAYWSGSHLTVYKSSLTSLYCRVSWKRNKCDWIPMPLGVFKFPCSFSLPKPRCCNYNFHFTGWGNWSSEIWTHFALINGVRQNCTWNCLTLTTMNILKSLMWMLHFTKKGSRNLTLWYLF